ncbi:MAG: sigma-70 family RNA polymerase sigma factor [Alphaproteobacteria bacterium]|nr:sigma-70 family RNA polymerase sigma factor [Alphaproteobacteria bacterium]
MTDEAGSGAHGTTPAFRQELVALIPRLRRFARGLTGTAADADDLVQAACERALARSQQWTPGTRLDSWVFRIVHTVWLDELRSRKVRAVDAAADPDAIIGDDGRARTEATLTLAAVRRFIAELPDEQRAVLLLVTVEGLAYKEAADALGVPVGTVMSRLSRARTALAARMEGGGPADGTKRAVHPLEQDRGMDTGRKIV